MTSLACDLPGSDYKITEKNQKVKDLETKTVHDEEKAVSRSEASGIFAAGDSPELLFPSRTDWGRVLVSTVAADYSASRLAHAVEEAQAHVINLNLVSESHPATSAAGPAEVVVDVRLSEAAGTGVLRSLNRYGFQVLDIHNPADSRNDDDVTAERARQVLRMLEI